MSCFRQIEEAQKAFLPSASELPSAQNNPYTKMTYFEVAYSATLQLPWL